ncbi:protein NEN1-like isoform X2 [Fagus crenata]
MDSSSEDRFEIAFFDVETTMPTGTEQGRAILEFGAILVCPRTAVELDSYSTLVKPADIFLHSFVSRANGITRDALASAPTFLHIADHVYDLLHGRVWAGHNIERFDSARIREAFAEIGKPAPEPKATFDSLPLLEERFGNRAGDMKLATLANYFELEQQRHRALDDVRLNLEVVKNCAAVLFWESSLPEIFPAQEDAFDMDSEESSEEYSSEMYSEESSEESSTAAVSESCDDSARFLEPDDVRIPAISADLVPIYRNRTQPQRMQLFHKDSILQLCCTHLKVWSGIRTNFARLNFVVHAPPSLCKVLNECDDHAQKVSTDSGSSSKWWPMVTSTNNYPTVKLQIPAAKSGDGVYATEIYKKDSGTEQRLVFRKFDRAKLPPLFTPGTFVDAFFSLDTYDYKQNAGIHLVAKKLVINSN